MKFMKAIYLLCIAVFIISCEAKHNLVKDNVVKLVDKNDVYIPTYWPGYVTKSGGYDTLTEGEEFCMKFYLHNRDSFRLKPSDSLRLNISVSKDGSTNLKSIKVTNDTGYYCMKVTNESRNNIEKKYYYGRFNVKYAEVDTPMVIQVEYYVKKK